MTLQELNTLFDAACNAQQRANSEDVTLWSCRGAGLKAVVEALRDYLSNALLDERVHDAMNEILASDGVDEKAAGVDPAEPCALGAAYPSAAAPVCEWTLANDGCWQTSCGWGREAIEPYPVKCPVCGKPIEFKEGSE
jgi:hypothetical protein